MYRFHRCHWAVPGWLRRRLTGGEWGGPISPGGWGDIPGRPPATDYADGASESDQGGVHPGREERGRPVEQGDGYGTEQGNSGTGGGGPLPGREVDGPLHQWRDLPGMRGDRGSSVS